MTNNEGEHLELELPEAKWSNVNEYCDTIEKLRNASYQHYLRRMTYEWKMCITIWTPLVAIIGIILTKSNVNIGMIPLIIASLFIISIHIVWQLNLEKANALDLERSRKYEKEITKYVGIEINQERKGILIFKRWSHFIYVFITVGLVATSFYVNYSKQQKIITLPNDVQAWLETKHLISLEKKERYIINKLHEEMDSEKKTEKPQQQKK